MLQIEYGKKLNIPILNVPIIFHGREMSRKIYFKFKKKLVRAG